MELAAGIDPRDGPAAVADLDDFGNGRLHRIAGRLAVALDVVVGRNLDLTALDQRAFGRGAADVEHDQVRLADRQPTWAAA
jgi:hypothetical protein